MTVAINPVSTAPAYQPTVPTVSSTAAGALASTAASLSAQSAVVATLGGNTSGTSVYTPTGLLDSLQQAGTVAEPVSVPADGSNVDTSGAAQQALDQGIISTLPSTAATSGVYSGNGVLQGLPSALASANWAALLSANPGLASTVITDSYNSGLVSLLQVTA